MGSIDLLTDDTWTALLREIGCPVMFKMLTLTCKAVKHHVVHFAIANKIHFSFDCEYIASEGYLEILKWAFQNGYQKEIHHSSICSIAAESGNLEILKWATEHGCDLDSTVCSNAAKNGHFEILKWARGKGCPWGYLICRNAIENGHLEILKWAIENGVGYIGGIVLVK